ncbi:hypothetical protein D3C71_1428310 [compost metagenome]
MMGKIHPARRPAWSSRRADHQPQHAVAPAAHQLVIAFGEQVVDAVNPRRIQLEQRRSARVLFGLHQRQTGVAVDRVHDRPQVVGEPRGDGRSTAGVIRIEQQVLGVDRQELGRAGTLVIIGAAPAEGVGGAAESPRASLPAGQVPQPRVA